MNKFIILVAVSLTFSCSSMQSVNRSFASEEMQDVVLDEVVQSKISNKKVGCDLAVKANATKDKQQRLNLLAHEATELDRQTMMILGADNKGVYVCEESKFLMNETLKLVDRAECFESVVGKYYDVKAVKKGAAYAKAQAAFKAKVAAAEKVYMFNLPLNSKGCDIENYLPYFKQAPLEEVIPLINAK